MIALLRATAVALAAAAISIASIASGDTSTEASVGSSMAPSRAPAKPSKHRAKKKQKKQQKHLTNAPRAPHSMTLAASADLSPALAGHLFDESQLPAPSDGSCPSEMASVDGRFCVDKWEGSLVEIGYWGEKPFPYNETLDGREVRAISVPGIFPQGYISGVEASQACAKSGKRLCSSNEWRKACVGPDVKRFGYGDAREKGRCNDSAKSPMLAIWGYGILDSPEEWSPLKMNDPRLNELPGSLARTGSHPDCTNGYGVVDMVGNLHEWTSDPEGTFQGGYYLDTSLNGDGCAYRTTAHDFSYHDYSTGFRCCADPK